MWLDACKSCKSLLELWKRIKPFWNVVSLVLKDVMGYTVPKSSTILYLNNITKLVLKEDRYLVKILLTANN
uniref:Uncharacterized protein n=1 Tax=Anguilla anguilla TaxID=7936 RepID=A0A0E9XRR5_ANGAN